MKKNKKRIIALAHQYLITAEMPATPQERNFESCPCPKDCTLHGECLLCIAYHGRKKKLPRCER